MRKLLLASFLLVVGFNTADAQHRHVNLEDDKKIAEENGWIYDDLAKALDSAKIHKMPIMVVIRCPP